MFKSALRLAAASVLLLGALVAAPATVAHAVPTIDLVCAGTGTIEFSPGMKQLQARTSAVNLSDGLASCLDTSGAADPIVSGTWTATGSSYGTCLESSGTGTAAILWNHDSGAHSTSAVSWHTASANILTGLHVQAVVTSGTFAGDTVEVSIVPTSPTQAERDCLSEPGLTSAGGGGEATFVRP